MLISTIVMGIIAVMLVLIGFIKGGDAYISGIKGGLTMFVKILPLLLFAFIIAGMIEKLIPQRLLSQWVGKESGVRGILIGTMAGGICPGGPYLSLPVAAGLLHSGASVGTVVAFITSWSLWAISRLPMEVGILGWKITLIRLTSTFFFPPLAGILANTIFNGVK